MSWSREQVTCLLIEYKKYPCLYVIKSINYKNKHARADALEKILSELKCLRPNITIAEIKNKYGALHSNFLVEYRKHETSKKSGAGTNEIYRPNIWYYDLMTFILEHWLPKTSIYDSVNIDLGKQQNDHEHELPIEEKELQNISDDYLPVEETISSQDSIVFDGDVQNYSVPSTSFGNRKWQKKRKSCDKDDTLLESATSTLHGISTMLEEQKKSTKEDTIDIFLKFLGSKLRKIKDITIYENTEDKIFNIVNEALHLDRSTK